MTEQPITVRCTCCHRVNTADMDAAEYDALAAALYRPRKAEYKAVAARLTLAA